MKTILLVEDNEMNRDMLSRRLQRRGYTVITAVNGVEAVRQPMASGSTVEVPLTFARDSFVTIEVEGPASEAFAKVSPGFVPFAYSNPIYVDADGDGTWTPPGL